MIKVSQCKACHCDRLQRRSNDGLYNTGPFYCSATKRKELILELDKCPKNRIRLQTLK